MEKLLEISLISRMFYIIKSCFYKQVNKYEIFNLACGDEIKLNQLIKNIAKITNKKIKLKKPLELAI